MASTSLLLRYMDIGVKRSTSPRMLLIAITTATFSQVERDRFFWLKSYLVTTLFLTLLEMNILSNHQKNRQTIKKDTTLSREITETLMSTWSTKTIKLIHDTLSPTRTDQKRNLKKRNKWC